MNYDIFKVRTSNKSPNGTRYMTVTTTGSNNHTLGQQPQTKGNRGVNNVMLEKNNLYGVEGGRGSDEGNRRVVSLGFSKKKKIQEQE